MKTRKTFNKTCALTVETSKIKHAIRQHCQCCLIEIYMDGSPVAIATCLVDRVYYTGGGMKGGCSTGGDESGGDKGGGGEAGEGGG
jgi:hypothetical protein